MNDACASVSEQRFEGSVRSAWATPFFDKSSQPQVAVKVLEYTAGESEKQGMEALLSTQLSHPNVVQVRHWDLPGQYP